MSDTGPGSDTAAADPKGFAYNPVVFTPVARRKKKSRGAVKVRSPTEAVERCMAELRADSQWVEKCSQIIREAAQTLPAAEITTILCIGLGSPVESVQARFQLCFLLEIRDTILPNRVSVRAYDPVFSSEDILLLTSLGIQILPDNKGGYEIDGTTLAFMPHCDRELYENLLRTNWDAPSLARLLLVGNDLHRYTESIPTRVLGQESPCLSRLAPLLASASLPEHALFPNAFSSTAVQRISLASLGAQPSSFWHLP